MIGSTYYASAHFYMNYKMLGYSNVRMYQFRNDGTGTLLAQQTACFGKYGGFDLNGVAWTMDSQTTSIVASVGMNWDNNTRSWIKEGYSNAYVAWSGNNADVEWNNNAVSVSVIAGQPPQPPGGGGVKGVAPTPSHPRGTSAPSFGVGPAVQVYISARGGTNHMSRGYPVSKLNYEI